jgi:hypothetical protein
MKPIEEYRKEFQETVKVIEAEYPQTTSPGLRGLITGRLNSYCRGDANRKQFLKALTGHSSSKDMSDAEWLALRWFLDPENDDEIISKYGERDIDAVLAAAMPPQERLF